MEISNIIRRTTGGSSSFSMVPITDISIQPINDIINGHEYFHNDGEPVIEDTFLFIDTLERITRSDILPSIKLPPKKFIPKKLTENAVFTLPVLFTKENILPSDSFLLRFDENSEYKKVIEFVLNGPKWIFVVLQKVNEKTSIFGSTVEIFRTTGLYASVIYTVFLMAHQMCEILDVKPFVGNTTIGFAKIKIIPANISCYPFQKLGPNMRNHYSRGDNAIGDRCLQTPWPSWVYKQLDSVNLPYQLVARVNLLYSDVNLIFADPYLLSFEVLNLNIFTKEQKHYLRALNSTNQRLNYEIESLDNLLCFCCSAVVTSVDNIFQMPRIRYRYHNSDYYDLQNMGMIYTTKLNINIIVHSKLTGMYCLFHKYQWQEFSCGSCSNILGWLYVCKKQSVHTPKFFYGLKRSAITSTKNYLPKHLKQNENKPRADGKFVGYWSLI